MSNYLGKNEGAPYYLTPVFFKKEVLQKYYSHPELYTIKDSLLTCQGLWSMSIDNHHRDIISAYLGDLGRDLPEEEQLYWKTYNIACDENISDVQFKRDFCNLWTAPEISDLKFKSEFDMFQNQWHEAYGWYLFKPLEDKDIYNLDKLHIPIHNTQDEFDFLILSLVKSIIDSINEKELNKLIKDNVSGSINKLEMWFKEMSIPNYEKQIEFLRNLQSLRSTGTGHRKGENYEKAAKRFNLTDNFKEVFDNILKSTMEFIEFIDEKILKQI